MLVGLALEDVLFFEIVTLFEVFDLMVELLLDKLVLTVELGLTGEDDPTDEDSFV